MTYEEYLQKHQDIINCANEIVKSNVYKKAQEFMNSSQYKEAIKYLQKIDKEVHKDILEKITLLQNSIFMQDKYNQIFKNLKNIDSKTYSNLLEKAEQIQKDN